MTNITRKVRPLFVKAMINDCENVVDELSPWEIKKIKFFKGLRVIGCVEFGILTDIHNRISQEYYRG